MLKTLQKVTLFTYFAVINHTNFKAHRHPRPRLDRRPLRH